MSLKCYAVGGCVRDKILGKEPHDIDIVVVGASFDIMKKLGFINSGKSFPVFIHPKTKMEFALARKEIKTGDKHTDFEFVWEDVSLEEDLLRRDFTCNALAYPVYVHWNTGEIEWNHNDDGFTIDKVIDFHNGIQDIQNREIKVVCKEHFIEDPLRILRFCRFMAQLGFDASDETLTLIKGMVDDGMLNHLTPERVWREFEKALMPNVDSRKFFETMMKIGALQQLLPEVARLNDINENPKWHSAGTTFGHIMCALDVVKDSSSIIKWGVLLHDIGKYKSYTATLNRYNKANIEHNGRFKTVYEYTQWLKDNHVKNYYMPHDDDESVSLADEITHRLCHGGMYKQHLYSRNARNAVRFHMCMWKVFDGMKAGKIQKMLSGITNFFKQREYLELLLEVCKADNESDKTEACYKSTKHGIQTSDLLNWAMLECFDRCSKITLSSIMSPEKIEETPIAVRNNIIVCKHIDEIKKVMTQFKIKVKEEKKKRGLL